MQVYETVVKLMQMKKKKKRYQKIYYLNKTKMIFAMGVGPYPTPLCLSLSGG